VDGRVGGRLASAVAALLIQLLEPDSRSVACGSQCVNDSVILPLDLTDYRASAAKLSQPLLMEPKMVRDQIKAAVDDRFDPGQCDCRLPLEWGAFRELDDGVDCLGFPACEAQPAVGELVCASGEAACRGCA